MDKNEIRNFIARRAAQELHDGDVVNLNLRIQDTLQFRFSHTGEPPLGGRDSQQHKDYSDQSHYSHKHSFYYFKDMV